MNQDAIHKSVVVPCDKETAFRLWTEEITRWWPAGHTQSGRADTQIFFEKYAGGRFFERTPEGAEYDWGQVVAWDPPQQLIYEWYPGSGPERPTRVQVSFISESEKQTRLEIVHKGAEILGELWASRSISFANSWDKVILCYFDYVNE